MPLTASLLLMFMDLLKLLTLLAVSYLGIYQKKSLVEMCLF